jgi:hypothetical protein
VRNTPTRDDHPAAIRQVPWNADLVSEQLVWPPGREQDPGYDGPWVSELDIPARDVPAQADEFLFCWSSL